MLVFFCYDVVLDGNVCFGLGGDSLLGGLFWFDFQCSKCLWIDVDLVCDYQMFIYLFWWVCVVCVYVDLVEQLFYVCECYVD